MKNLILLISILFLAACSSTQDASTKLMTNTIKTSAQCGMCKDKIEGTLAKVDGVEQYRLDVTTQKLKVSYNPDVITLDEVKRVITGLGYDADDKTGDKTAYEQLPACCKKDGGHH